MKRLGKIFLDLCGWALLAAMLILFMYGDRRTCLWEGDLYASVRDCTLGPMRRAIADFNDAIRLDPKSLALAIRGFVFEQIGDHDRAIADYDQAIRLDPEYAFAYYAIAYNNRAVAYHAKGDYDRAIADYDQAIRLDPKYAIAYNNRGVAYHAKRDDDRAVADLHQAIRLDPEFAFAYRNRGDAYYAKNDYDHAIADYDQAIRLDPKYAAALVNRGLAFEQRGDAARARADFEAALAARPGDKMAAEGLARLTGSAAPRTDIGAVKERVIQSGTTPPPQLGTTQYEIYSRLREYCAAGDYAAARAEGQRLEAISRSDSNHTGYMTALEALAIVYESQGKHAEAADFRQRALAIRERAPSPSDLDASETLQSLAGIYLACGHRTKAEQVYVRAHAILEKSAGPDDISSIHRTFKSYFDEGLYTVAESLAERLVKIEENAYGTEHPEFVAGSLCNLALVYKAKGRESEAERLYIRALVILEKALREKGDVPLDVEKPLRGQPWEMAEIAIVLQNLANLYSAQGRLTDAERLHRRALAIREKLHSKEDVAISMVNLAKAYSDQGRFAEADRLYVRALTITETRKLDADELLSDLVKGGEGIATLEMMILGNRAGINYAQNRLDTAEQLYLRALAIAKKGLGPEHPDSSHLLDGLGKVYQSLGRNSEAERNFRHGLAILESKFGSEHPQLIRGLHHLGLLLEEQGRWAEAYSILKRAVAIRVAFGGSAHTLGPVREGRIDEAKLFLDLVEASRLLSGAQPPPEPNLRREAFEIAQWAVQSSVSAALQQMALRSAAGNNELAALVRDDQDLAAAWRGRTEAFIAALAEPEGQQDRATLDRLRQQIAKIENERAANAARLDKEFPDYAALANPKPLSVEEAQKLLNADEALVFILPGDKESYIFALTRDAFNWKTIPLGKEALSDKVAAIRKGLSVEKRESFDLNIAQELYAALLGPVETLIKDKRHLLVAGSGPLTALPFHLLVTEKQTRAAPDDDRRAAYRDAAWLVKRHAVSVLPSVTSLKALRLFARRGQGAKPMIGFGDPVFDPEKTPAAETAAKQRGSAKSRIKTASRATRAYSGVWNGAEIDYKALAKLERLDDTADELKAVRLALGAQASDIHIGKDASETTVKRVPLADYRIVYFATHAAVAGQVKGLGEPLLVLTVPKQPTEIDDGVLTASEVAQLKLNANWVVLAACNTDAGDKEGAEALSGLARAFFYAGARALLVSHWEVDSDAAAKLNIATFDILKADPGIGRAEAVRRAMLAYMNDASKPSQVYPALWGAFSVVGEGAAR